MKLEVVDGIHGGVDVLERGLQLRESDRHGSRLLLDLCGVVPHHLRGALDQVRRRGVQGRDLIENQSLISKRLCHDYRRAEGRDCCGGSPVDTFDQLDVVLDDDVDGDDEVVNTKIAVASTSFKRKDKALTNCNTSS